MDLFQKYQDENYLNKMQRLYLANEELGLEFLLHKSLLVDLSRTPESWFILHAFDFICNSYDFFILQFSNLLKWIRSALLLRENV